ncbi:MAG: response regulator [Gammaproteobacteria bacterium]|nr:response regulator [Gammaproteobacteria bacterium]
MTDSENILIAAEDVHDARLVFEMLDGDFARITISTKAEKAVEDFERQKPAVLVLAFTSLAKAQGYYRGLYRSSPQAHAQLHKTLVLCNKDELKDVYALCRKGHFTNYILFWPLGYDATRLSMEVYRALQQVSYATAGGPTVREFAAQAREIDGLGAMLDDTLAEGEEHITRADDALRQLTDDIGQELAQLPAAVGLERSIDASSDPSQLALEAVISRLREKLDRFSAETMQPRLQTAAAAMEPLQGWMGDARRNLTPKLQGLRDMQALAEKVRAQVLLVEDDPLQHRLLQQLLIAEPVELVFASNSYEAFAAIHRRRPDLILMDVNLPDINGIETTRRLKATPGLAAIPVIMVTGHRQKEIVVQSRQAGAQDFIAKPFDREVVLKKIKSVMSSVGSY